MDEGEVENLISNNIKELRKISGGERGIRTLGTLASTTVFETAPFDHSGISPQGLKGCGTLAESLWFHKVSIALKKR